MGFITKGFLSGIAFVLLAQAGMAENRLAILIANERYDTLRRATGVGQVLNLEGRLEEEGFRVLTFGDLNEEKLAELVADLPELLDNNDRVLIAVSGHLVQSGRESWLLSTDADEPQTAVMGMDGVALNGLADLLGQKAGAAVLLIGAPGRAPNMGQGVVSGYSPAGLAQGVSVFYGPTKALVDWAEDELLEPGRSIEDAAASAGDEIAAHGFLPPAQSFLPVPAGTAEKDAADDVLFLLAQKLGTKEAYQQYLEKFPAGRHASQARLEIEALAPSPEELAMQAEEALNLSRDQRRRLQSDLTILGHDTNGVDGIFGRGTRRAISAWQRANSLDETGYLDAEQVAVLQDQAAEKRAKVRAEDDALWVQTRRADTEEGYREYLRRFPEGLYADIAREEVQRFEREREPVPDTREAELWARAQSQDTPDAYRDYLSQYPDGAHTVEAIARLVELESGAVNRRDIERARREEQGYFGNVLPRLLAERQLSVLGFNPGLIDGTFDDQTRGAVRRFQQDNSLMVTGYIDNQTRDALF